MERIETRVDTSTQEYRENYTAMQTRVSNLEEELEKARNERSERALARLAEQNKMSVRERLDHLLDRNTPFLEIAPLAAMGMYDKKIHGAGIVSGRCFRCSLRCNGLILRCHPAADV